MKKKFRKATNLEIVQSYLNERKKALINGGYPVSQWIIFSEYFLERGYSVNLYEARQTVSKYVTVSHMDNNLQFKVRFSNHAPIRRREEAGDCDFFVGRTNFKTTTTAMAIMACLKRFESWR